MACFLRLQRASVVEGNDFRDAQPSTDQEGRPNMTFTLTTDAGNRFWTYTSAHSKDSASPGVIFCIPSSFHSSRLRSPPRR